MLAENKKWEQLYEQAVMEGDSEKMPERVVATRVRPSPEGCETWNTTATIIRKDAESKMHCTPWRCLSAR